MMAIRARIRLNNIVTMPASRTATLDWMPCICSNSPTIVTPSPRNEEKMVSDRAAPIAPPSEEAIL